MATTPTGADLGVYMRLGTAEVTVESALLTDLVASAVAVVQDYLSVPIDAVAETFVVDRATRHSPNRWAFAVPAAPIAASPAPVVLEASGATVDPTLYRVDLLKGLFYRGATGTGPVAVTGSAFVWDRWPYTVTVTWGLSALPTYASQAQLTMRRAILDLAADWYQNRNAQARGERAGGGIAVDLLGEDLPPRVKGMLNRYRRVPV